MSKIQSIYKNIGANKSLCYLWFESMHTRIDIIICNTEKERAIEIAHGIAKELERLVKIADRFKPTSEISRVNKTAHLSPIVVSEDLFKMVSYCIEAHRKTAACFDISINSQNHNKDTIHSIILNKEDSSIFFLDQSVEIDLNACVKGYALDLVKDILQKNSARDALISFGNSSIMAFGNQHNSKGWYLGFQPQEEDLNQSEIILHNECITSSGNLSQEHFHVRYPKTNAYVVGRKSFSVITQTALEGEILSTALFVANDEEALFIAQNFNYKVA